MIDFPTHIKTYVDTLVMLFNNINPPHPLTLELQPFLIRDPVTQLYCSDYSQVTPYLLAILEICFDRDTSPITAKAKDAAADLFNSVTRSVSKER